MVTANDAVRGKIVNRDPTHDLALIQIDRVPNDVDALPFAPKEPEVGEEVHSIGNPGASNALWVYTNGKVRDIQNMSWTAGDETLILKIHARVLETDSPTNPGDSGGPCVNDRGELVGVTQGGSATANAMSLFIERSEAEKFIKKSFEEKLAGKAWQRSQRPTLVAAGGGGAATLPDLIIKLGSKEDAVRAAGVQGLVLLGADAHAAIPELVRALGDSQSFVRRQAANALRQCGQPTKDDIGDLIPLLKEVQNSESKIYVLEALTLLGGEPKAAPGADHVVKLCSDNDAEVRAQAMLAAGKMLAAIGESPGRSLLEKGLTDSDKKVRAAAATTLTTAVAAVKSDVPTLQGMLKNKELEVRAAAARALARLGGERAKPATADLLAALSEDNTDLRRACYLALKVIKPAPEQIMPVLKKGIKDNDVEVRRAALELAGGAGAAAKNLVPVIADALSDSDVRLAALAAMKGLGPDAKEEAFKVASLLAIEQSLRSEVLDTLDKMKLTGLAATQVVKPVIAALEDERQKLVHDRIVKVLASLCKAADREGRDLLAAALRSSNALVRLGAVESFAAMGKDADPYAQHVAKAIISEVNPALQDQMKAAWQRK
jgi:HEAT repeat protein